MKTTEQGISLKLFFGMLLTPDIKIKLQQSREWLGEAIGSNHSADKMIIVHYRNKEYLGIYIEWPVKVAELKTALMNCKKKLQDYLPDVHVDIFRPTIFPQLFIS